MLKEAMARDRHDRQAGGSGLELAVKEQSVRLDQLLQSYDMKKSGVAPNVVPWRAIIDACTKVGNPQRAEHWHDRMVQSGIDPNAHSVSALINACAKMASMQGAEAAERWIERPERSERSEMPICGLFVPVDSFPASLQWVQYLCPLEYAINLATLTEFKIVKGTFVF